MTLKYPNTDYKSCSRSLSTKKKCFNTSFLCLLDRPLWKEIRSRFIFLCCLLRSTVVILNSSWILLHIFPWTRFLVFMGKCWGKDTGNDFFRTIQLPPRLAQIISDNILLPETKQSSPACPLVPRCFLSYTGNNNYYHSCNKIWHSFHRRRNSG